MQFHTLFGHVTQAIRKTICHLHDPIAERAHTLGNFAQLSDQEGRKPFLPSHTNHPYLYGETNRRWRRDTPWSDAKRWPRNNNIATARGGVKSSPIYQLIEEGMPT